MSIQKHRPKVGEILECNYGIFAQTLDFNGHIPPEMIKRRMVVVLNGKLNGLALVVPISSTQNVESIRLGHHIEIAPELIHQTVFYDKRTRWAKADLIQAVSRERLFFIYEKGKRIQQFLPRETVEKIQRAVIKLIGANSLLDNANELD